jgi:integrase
MRPLQDYEFPAFLNAIAGHPLEPLFYVAAFTGMRESEIIGLSWDCVDFEKGTIHLYRQLKRTREKGVNTFLLL